MGFLDIEGAFNNIRSKSIIKVLGLLDTTEAVNSFVGKLLRYRRIESTHLWNINMKSLLNPTDET